MSVPSPSYAAFPVIQAGRHPQLHFRGLLELYACYGLPGCSPTKVGLVTRHRPIRSLEELPAGSLVSYHVNR